MTKQVGEKRSLRRRYEWRPIEERLLDPVRELCAEGTRPTARLLAERQGAVYVDELRTHFGTLRSAYGQAGPVHTRAWALARLHEASRDGVAPRSRELPREVRFALRRQIGGYPDVLRVAGLKTPRPARSRQGRAQVRAELRALHAQGVRLTVANIRAAVGDRLVHAVYRQYGSFDRARRAAGVGRVPPKPSLPIPPLEVALEAIAELARSSGRTPFRNALPQWIDATLTAHRLGYLEALERLRLHRTRRWNRETIAVELRRLHARGFRLTVDRLVEAGRADVVMAVYRHIGSIVEARRLAGLE